MLHVALPASWSLLVATAFASDPAPTTEIVSVADDGSVANDRCFEPSISADGNRIAFWSVASNLVPGDTNGKSDVFVHDRAAGTTIRVSVASDGTEANGPSKGARISADGTAVVFESDATNLDAADKNGWGDIFVHELPTGVTTRVSKNDAGVEGNSLSGRAEISADGRYVAFDSYSDNLDAGDTNGNLDVFLRDRTAATTRRVNVRTDGAQSNGPCANPAISGDGRYVVFSGITTSLDPADTDSYVDIYVRDVVAGTTELASVDSAGVKGNFDSFAQALSGDGSTLAFASRSFNLDPGDTLADVDVFVRDLASGTTVCASVDSLGRFDKSDSENPAISATGRFVVFVSDSAKLVPADGNSAWDVFCRSPATPLTSRLSLAADGSEGDDDCVWAAIDADGSHVAFESDATNLVATPMPIGQIYLRTRRLDDASTRAYGHGWPGTLGTPALTATAPVVNHDVDVRIENSWGRSTIALLLLGVDRVEWPTSAGGEILVDPIVALPLALGPEEGTVTGTVPADELLVGAELFAQAIELDPGASHGLSFTRGVKLRLGF